MSSATASMQSSTISEEIRGCKIEKIKELIEERCCEEVHIENKRKVALDTVLCNEELFSGLINELLTLLGDLYKEGNKGRASDKFNLHSRPTGIASLS